MTRPVLMFNYAGKNTFKLHIVMLEAVAFTVDPDLLSDNGPVRVGLLVGTAENVQIAAAVGIPHQDHVGMPVVDPNVVIGNDIYNFAPDIVA